MALNKKPLPKECIKVLGILCGIQQETSKVYIEVLGMFYSTK